MIAAKRCIPDLSQLNNALLSISTPALARQSAGLCCLGIRKGGKPVLSRAAVCANPPPPADYGPASEQRGLDIDLVETGEVTRVVKSFHVNGWHDPEIRGVGSLRSNSFSWFFAQAPKSVISELC
jgi:hypothetical protein